MSFESTNNHPISRTEVDPYGIQHDPLDYSSPSYLHPARMSSYGYQYKLAMGTGGNSFINVGSGNHLLKYLLTTQKKSVIDFDLDFKTQPDVAGVFPYLPFRDKLFDIALCFQTLEHFPLSMFRSNLSELIRISSKVIISIPDITRSKSEKLKNEFYRQMGFPKEWSVYRDRSIDQEHFWEIGDGSITTQTILNLIDEENLKIAQHFRNKLNPYHHFFIFS